MDNASALNLPQDFSNGESVEETSRGNSYVVTGNVLWLLDQSKIQVA